MTRPARPDTRDHAAASTFASAEWLLVLLASGVVVYLPALWGVFVFDDYPWIVHNARLAAFDVWLRRPFTLLTFVANLQLGGPGPVGFHLVNIGLHLANTTLVYLLIRRSAPLAAPRPIVAAAGAALFLLHPAQTGAVTYVSGRSTSLMTFWLLVAHLSTLRSLKTDRVGWRAASLGGLVLAVASKETALIYPVLLIAWLVFGEGLGLIRSMKLAVPPLLASAALIAAMALHPGYRALLAEGAASATLSVTPIGRLEQHVGLGFCFNDGQPRAESCTARRVEGAAGLARFVVAPWTISIDPGRRAVTAVDVLTVALAAIAVWLALRSAPGPAAAGVAWFVTALIPTHVIFVRSEPVSDRLLYLPMVGLALVAAAGAGRAAREARRPAFAAGCAAFIVLAGLTWQRNRQYGSEIWLWQDAVAKNDKNARAHANLGYAYELHGDFKQAEFQYGAALRLQPDSPWAKQGLSRLQVKRQEAGWR